MKKKKLRCTRCGHEFYSDKSEDVCDVCGSVALAVEEPWEILFSYMKVEGGKITFKCKRQ